MAKPRVVSWSPAEWKENLSKRLQGCLRHRVPFEDQWKTNANIVYNPIGRETGDFNVTFDNVIELESGEVDEGDSETGSNYTFKFVRFKHGQLASNPPTVIARPTSPDHKDRQAADAADRLIRHGYEDGKVQELFDQATLKGIVRGIGWIKQTWNPHTGDVVDFNEETSEISFQGDIDAYSPASLDIWVDPVATSWEKCRYVFEAIYLPLDEAVFRWPSMAKQLKQAIIKEKDYFGADRFGEDVVKIFEYWEKSLPLNGMVGRHAFLLEDGTLLASPTKNPHYKHRLPYYPFTEIDLEDQIYAKSSVEYVARIQDHLNRFDSAMVDAMQAHGAIRLAVPSSTEIMDDEISTSNFDIVRYEGAIPPHFIQPTSLPPDMSALRNQMKEDVQDMMGFNDAMLGVQKRETSGFSQQTAVEAGNIGNRRVFNKYSAMVKAFWQDRLGIIRDKWSIPRTIAVLGEENAFEAKSIKGADIAGGFDIVVEHGQSLPIDPNARREQIMLLMEPLKEAGVPMTRILKLLKLNDLDSLYDELRQGELRQREIFDEMLALFDSGEEVYMAPQELENHESMLMYCQKFRMSMEFKLLPNEVKALIEQHIKERMELAAQVATQGQPQQAAPAPQAPMGPPTPSA